MDKIFLINLKPLHDKTGLSYYAVSKAAGVTQNTVRKYAMAPVLTERFDIAYVQLCEFYGVDWRDPKVIQIVDADDVEEEHNALLAVPA